MVGWDSNYKQAKWIQKVSFQLHPKSSCKKVATFQPYFKQPRAKKPSGPALPTAVTKPNASSPGCAKRVLSPRVLCVLDSSCSTAKVASCWIFRMPPYYSFLFPPQNRTNCKTDAWPRVCFFADKHWIEHGFKFLPKSISASNEKDSVELDRLPRSVTTSPRGLEPVTQWITGQNAAFLKGWRSS